MKTKMMMMVGALICLGAVSQVVEHSIDKEEVKTFVTDNLKEQDEKDATIDFDVDEKEENTFFEKIGF